jgi:hypothetical protein
MEALATQAPESSTPILDRLAPMPPFARPRRKTIFLVVVVSLVVGVSLDALIFLSPGLWQGLGLPFIHWLERPWTGIRALSLGLALVFVTYATLSIHEAGHVFAGLAAGFRFVSVRVGPLVLDRSFRISWYRGLGAVTSGLATMTAGRKGNLRLRAGVFVLGGPAANLLSGGLALALLPVGSLASTLILALNALMFVGSTVPYRSLIGLSDGRRLWILWRHGELSKRWLALMRLETDSREGVLTQARLDQYLTAALAVRDASPDTVIAHSYAFSAAFNRRRNVEAGELLEICLRYSGYASSPLRDLLIGDAVLFQARRRKRADLAALWLADLKSTSLPWLRSRSEAALLEAQGDIAGALRKLDDYEAGVLALPNKAHRDLLLRALPGWRSELLAA